MKIENGYHKYLQSIQQTTKTQPSKKVTNSNEQTQEKTVQVNISEEAKRLSEAANQGHSARVEKIKQAIANNTYKVSPEDISKGMMQAMRNQRGNE